MSAATQWCKCCAHLNEGQPVGKDNDRYRCLRVVLAVLRQIPRFAVLCQPLSHPRSARSVWLTPRPCLCLWAYLCARTTTERRRWLWRSTRGTQERRNQSWKTTSLRVAELNRFENAQHVSDLTTRGPWVRAGLKYTLVHMGCQALGAVFVSLIGHGEGGGSGEPLPP